MSLALLVLHMMIAAALVGVVLLQKSEGGALGIGGGGGGGFLTGRGTANLLTRTTAILAAAFFTTSLTLTLIANHTTATGSIVEKTISPGSTPPTAGDASKPAEAGTPADAPKSEGHGILDKLQAPTEQIPR